MENENALALNWKENRDKLRQHWHSLTDGDLDIIAGDRNVLASILQEKYGYTNLTAQAAVDRFLIENTGMQTQTSQPGSNPRDH